MSESELQGLMEKHKDEPLPPGWFFDGAVFVDYEGNRRTERPGKLYHKRGDTVVSRTSLIMDV